MKPSTLKLIERAWRASLMISTYAKSKKEVRELRLKLADATREGRAKLGSKAQRQHLLSLPVKD